MRQRFRGCSRPACVQMLGGYLDAGSQCGGGRRTPGDTRPIDAVSATMNDLYGNHDEGAPEALSPRWLPRGAALILEGIFPPQVKYLPRKMLVVC